MATLTDRTGQKKKRELKHLVAQAGSSPLLSPLLLSPSGDASLAPSEKGEDPQAFPKGFQAMAEASARSVHG